MNAVNPGHGRCELLALLAIRPELDAPLSAPANIAGLADFARAIFVGEDLRKDWDALMARAGGADPDAGAMLDLSTLLQLTGQRESGLALQSEALDRQRWYRRLLGSGAGPRLLVLAAAGDLMANTPVEFLLAGWCGALDVVYLRPGEPTPDEIPDHDVAMLAVGESDANASILAALTPRLAAWPRPILNGAPGAISALGREPAARRLASIPGVNAPATQRLTAAELAGVRDFPIIARPVDSHAGAGLEKLGSAAGVARYLRRVPAGAYYAQPFVDYSGPDGRFRKLRIALVGGAPFLVHMAISDHWMVHYLNAGMDQDAGKRAEEAAMFERFDTDFAARHAAALAGVAVALGLDYVALDCAEDHEGRLLVFEADTAMIVHDMDPPDVFPYKAPAMRRLFAAFQSLVNTRAGRP